MFTLTICIEYTYYILYIFAIATGYIGYLFQSTLITPVQLVTTPVLANTPMSLPSARDLHETFLPKCLLSPEFILEETRLRGRPYDTLHPPERGL